VRSGMLGLISRGSVARKREKRSKKKKGGEREIDIESQAEHRKGDFRKKSAKNGRWRGNGQISEGSPASLLKPKGVP